MDKDGNEWVGFSLLKMYARDGDNFTDVFFMGRLLIDCISESSAEHPEGSRYIVALTPTNSYFVFNEELDIPELRSYEVYDCFDWMEESHEVPQTILDAVSSAIKFDPAEDNMALDA